MKSVRILGSEKLRPLKGKLSASSWRDLKGKLYEIFGGPTIRVSAVRTGGRYWILDLFGERCGSVVIKDGKVVSYGVLEKNDRGDLLDKLKLYIKHKEREYHMKFGVGDYVIFEFRFIGSVITPLIMSKSSYKGDTVYFPEFDKTYNGKRVEVGGGWACLNVCVFDSEGYLRTYVLLPSGESVLAYEDANCYVRDLYLSPSFYKVGNVFLVGVHHKRIMEGRFTKIPGHRYIYLTQTPTGRVYISFNLKNWTDIGNVGIVGFKDCKAEVSGKYLIFQGVRDVCP